MKNKETIKTNIYSLLFLYVAIFVAEIAEHYFNVPINKSSILIIISLNLFMVIVMIKTTGSSMIDSVKDMKEKIDNINEYYDELELNAKEIKRPTKEDILKDIEEFKEKNNNQKAVGHPYGTKKDPS